MVSLIIVDYKTIPKTLQYIRECYEMITDSTDMHAIIVDNCEDPTNGMQLVGQTADRKLIKMKQKGSKSAEVFRCNFEGRELLYICARQNLGYAKGNNLGAEIAQSVYQDHYYLFSNNDLRFPHKFEIQQLLLPMQNSKKIAAVGPRITTITGEIQSPRKKIGIWKQLFLNYYDLLLPKGIKITNKITDVDASDKSKTCYWVTGSFLLTDAMKFHEVGGFDEKTFLYCEEVILAERLQRKSYDMYYENSVSVVHEHGQTVKAKFNALRGIHISFYSTLYYYAQYRRTNRIIIFLAKINYSVFEILFKIKKKVGRLL